MDISKIFTTPQLYILLFTVAAAFAAAISAYKDNITSEKIDNGVS